MAQTPKIKKALERRNRKLDAAQENYSKAVAKINAEFAESIRAEAQNKSMVALANEAGVTGQVLHDIVHRHPAAA